MSTDDIDREIAFSIGSGKLSENALFVYVSIKWIENLSKDI